MDGHPSVTVDGKTAVVIGGTSGIGEAIALGLADDGADVVATSRTAEDVAATAESLRDAGATTIEEPCDVTDRESIRTLCDRVLDEVGEVDILVNSAGTAARSGLLGRRCSTSSSPVSSGPVRSSPASWTPEHRQHLVDVGRPGANQTGSLLRGQGRRQRAHALCRQGVRSRHPRERDRAGLRHHPDDEGGVRRGDGAARTDQERIPPGRVAEREEIVGSAIYLGSDASSFTTGEVMFVDGGFTRSAL